MQITNSLLNVQRLPEHASRYYEIKDPTVVETRGGQYLMFASIGNSIEQHWQVGRFISDDPQNGWQELPPVKFQNISGPQLCAPAVTLDEINGKEIWTMYIQTACFEENGVIAVAYSEDGETFTGEQNPVVTKDNVQQTVVGVYDVGISEIKHQEQDIVCMLYSGYRKVGCGDIYMSFKSKSESAWSLGEKLLAQEDVPFHNHPDHKEFEWGLEGAKLIQLSDSCYIMIGVCFLPKPHSALGSRQRVFIAGSKKMNGPYTPLGLPFIPTQQLHKNGENGHPDTFLKDNNLCVIYQERDGDGQPWYLRFAQFDLKKLENFVNKCLEEKDTVTLNMPISEDWEQYHFHYADNF